MKSAAERFAGHRQALAAKVHAAGVKHGKTLEAIATVPRHAFMDAGLHAQAYEDSALPIGHQQTISKPSVVARMIEILHKPKHQLGKVLEIGTGCGYQAAVLSLLAQEVYSIERIRPLHDMAREKLRPFRIKNLRLIYGDGILGLPQAAPFDAIILAAAGLGIPDALLDQLAIGGRLVAPVAKNEKEQQLVMVERMSSHRYQRTVLDEVFFVPLQSGVV
ncbi:protein-L-isoaspartate(D-aspartate) O-methyltransferase [Polynucleobacter paneuropaeus]|uniref:Protein-L-isoaspartate O-methyltransferase n=1 Tax=Polynucleobacter paneuropaeus TaxID=2527775 RepID=A0A2Z4JLY3_9BURK|nr:protein-L-isoaspartate(D-aspartate) O-methyltransferase [Polynucleobacter paneuropaeus]AWW45994.1 protein-L-isoaspartate(D-aspartate) O-methyltransferase [Polynucleobacter paneuropaeus]AWW47854.1 protein-L-isoaspartate(D-aspartate) O-methyltransferase [Polynucleobacter paneuropaeus]AWW49899.1 protein-L-isoaspartate(D-aspartate) O-methyltransferase [Polynucleobacter paneuropaeus]MBT8514129.1 protein-L-isoaspartate(D-aspartate) O-methyltransferase [Polynucleobacter paneuropaeus]